jgi:Peptidase family M28
MKIYTYQPPTGAGSSGNEIPPLAPGTSWVRFGKETILYQDEEPAQELALPAGRGAGLEQRRVAATREELYVVVQHGRLFQQHHPDVPVIHDRGRFLLVQLDPGRARELEGENETCYGLMPLAENQVVFEERKPAAMRAPAAFVQNLVNKVMRTHLEANLTKLASFATRHSTSKEFGKAVTWARKQLDEMNYKVRLQQVKVNGKASRNIIAEREGQGGGSRKIVVVTAHLDSINLQGGPLAPAPGADDNGSGSAGLLEIARVFHDHDSRHTLRLILFGGEEQGLFGSKRYVTSLAGWERAGILAVVNMDMIGSLNSPTRSVLLEGAPLSQNVIDGLSQAAAAHTQLIVESSLNPFASDHVPFIKAGIPAVLTIEGADNTNSSIHSGEDTLDKIDYDMALEILRMNVAFVAGAIGAV